MRIGAAGKGGSGNGFLGGRIDGGYRLPVMGILKLAVDIELVMRH